MTKKKVIGIIVGILVLAAIGFGIYNQNFREEVEETISVERYTIAEPDSIFINGMVSPREIETFGTDFSLGNIETIHVSSGDSVGPGDPIVTYKRDGIDSQIASLEDQVEALKAARDEEKEEGTEAAREDQEEKEEILTKEIRSKDGSELEDMGFEDIDPNNFDLSQIDLSGIDLSGLNIPELDGLESGLGDLTNMPSIDYDTQISTLEDQIKRLREMETTTEYASISGIASIEDVNMQESMGTERVVVRSEDFVAKGKVNERDVLKIEEEMYADITVISTDKAINGRIEKVANRPASASLDISSIDINSAVSGGGSSSGQELSEYEVVFSLADQSDILEGFHIQAEVVYGDDVIVIPNSAIEKEGDKHFVYKIEDDRTVRTEVELAQKEEEKEGEEEESEDSSIIVSGLSYNDEIVLSDISKLSGGDKVE